MAAHINVYRRRRQQRQRLRRPRVFRDRTNPLEVLEEDEVFERYRFRPQTIGYILTLLPELMSPTKRNMPLPPLLQLLITLRFLATGAIHQLIGDSLSVSRATMNRVIRNVTFHLCQLAGRFIRFPHGDLANEVKTGFARIAGLFIIHIHLYFRSRLTLTFIQYLVYK